MRIVGVVHNESTTETIAVLGRQVTVVPERPCMASGVSTCETATQSKPCTCLTGNGEVVEEGVTSGNGALVHKGRTVGPVCALLEEAVPVLKYDMHPVSQSSMKMV